MALDIFQQIGRTLGFGANNQNRSDNAQPVQQAPSQVQQMNKGQPEQTNNPAQNNGNKIDQATGQVQGAQSTADLFADVWKNDPNAQGQQPQKLFNPDMESFNKAVQGMDFSQHASPELMQKALGGDQESLKALLNGVGRNAFSQNALTSSRMVEEAFSRKAKEFEKAMEEKFRSLSSRANLRKANPAFSDPAIKPIVEMFESQLRSKFPEATPEDITDKAQMYFGQLAEKIAKGSAGSQQQEQKQNDAGGEIDWLKFATDEPR